jgi:hypothetical protein
MTVWAAVNALTGAVACGIIGYKLLLWHSRFNGIERFGMGLLAGGCILTIAPTLWIDPTPFEEWSGALLRTGLAVYFIGRMLHHPSHDRKAK